MVLDWHLGSGYSVPYQEYAAAAATAAALQQQQDAAMQQQQQQLDGNPNSSSDHDKLFWLPDSTSLSPDGQGDQPLLDAIEICGEYCTQRLQQPEYDVSTAPIKAARADPRGKAVSLDACVEAFLQPEQLSEADEWYCPKCKEHVQVRQRVDNTLAWCAVMSAISMPHKSCAHIQRDVVPSVWLDLNPPLVFESGPPLWLPSLARNMCTWLNDLIVPVPSGRSLLRAAQVTNAIHVLDSHRRTSMWKPHSHSVVPLAFSLVCCAG
jgi:hypothetical protein